MKELDSYLNDHLAGSVGALELIGHWASAHKSEPLGAFFAELEGEVKADQDTLCSVMGSLRVEESKVRQAGAWIAEKVGRARLKIAGDDASSLGFVLTSEGLIIGIVDNKLLWHGLSAAKLPHLNGYDFASLQRRAQQLIERIVAQHIRAVQHTFARTARS